MNVGELNSLEFPLFFSDTDDDVILSKPWSPKYRNDFRIEPIAISTKLFETEDSSPIVEIVKQEWIEI